MSLYEVKDKEGAYWVEIEANNDEDAAMIFVHNLSTWHRKYRHQVLVKKADSPDWVNPKSYVVEVELSPKFCVERVK